MGRKEVYKPDRDASAMLYREMMHYVPRVKILHRITAFGNKEYAGYSVCGVAYAGDIRRFLLCACYIGLAATHIQGKDKVNISVKKILELSSFIDRNEGMVDYMLEHEEYGCHKRVLEEAFKILGYKADLAIKEKPYVVVNKISKIAGADTEVDGNTVWFDLHGEKQDLFSFRLYRSIIWLGY